MTWRLVAERLRDRFQCVAVDYRGHGDSLPPASGHFVWDGFGDDTCAVLDELEPITRLTGSPYGIGHSMGGAALLLAELRRPGTFAGLVLFEPVVMPPLMRRDDPTPIAAAARRRRADFESYDHAYTNFSAKPPMNLLDPASLRDYVDFGFRQTPSGAVRLKCEPEHEALTFEGARHNIWERLGEVRCPVLVLSGEPPAMGPGAVAALVASRLSNGEYQRWRFLSHFGPQQAPGLIAETAASFFASHP